MKDFEIFVIDIPALIEAKVAAMRGSKTEQTCVMAIEHTLAKMHKDSMECMCRDCVTLMDNKFTLVKAFAVCIPMFPVKGDDVIACAICDGCADRPDLLERMIEAMREICPSATLFEPQRMKQ